MIHRQARIFRGNGVAEVRGSGSGSGSGSGTRNGWQQDIAVCPVISSCMRWGERDGMLPADLTTRKARLCSAHATAPVVKCLAVASDCMVDRVLSHASG